VSRGGRRALTAPGKSQILWEKKISRASWPERECLGAKSTSEPYHANSSGPGGNRDLKARPRLGSGMVLGGGLRACKPDLGCKLLAEAEALKKGYRNAGTPILLASAGGLFTLEGKKKS